ncbi:MAG: hypothetical protein ACTHXO_01195 [Actinomycetaceae bacterium]
MTENAATARRMRRPGWRDPRLGVGVLLVAASVGVGAWAVDQASGTTEVWSATDVVTPGERLADAGLEVLEVNVGAAGDHYLLADDDLPADLVATRLVGAGELVPVAATGVATEQDVRPVVVPVDAALPSGLGAGSTVDLWRAPRTAVGDRSEDVPPPVVLAPEVLVAQIGTDDGVFAASGGASVELLVPAELVEDVLGAVAAGEELTVVPHHSVPVGEQ